MVALLVSGVFLWIALSRVPGVQWVAAASQADWRWLAAAMGLSGLGGLFASVRLHLMLSLTGGDVHPGATIRMVHAGRFLNLAGFGPSAGDSARSGLYGRWFGVPQRKTGAALLLDRLLGLAALALLLGGGAVVAAEGGVVGWLLGGGAALSVCGAAALWAGGGKENFVTGSFWRRLREAFGTLRRHPRQAARGLALGILAQVCLGGAMAACLKAVGPEPAPFLRMIWVFPAVPALASIPSVAGVGVRESAALALLGFYGVSAPDAVASALLFGMGSVCWAGFWGAWLWRESARMARVSRPGEARSISVVIPTWNEADALPETLERLQRVPEVVETIVADGGSADETVALAGRAGCRIVKSAAGRGRQLRAGAAVATGDVVLMLHADTWLETGAGAAVLRSLQDPTVVGGGFWKEFREGTWLMAGSRWRCAPRLFLFRRVLGDQGIFVRRETLESVGGVPDLPLMEEFRLCELLNRRGRLALAGSTVFTSARRFRKLGAFRTYFRMWRVTVLYHLGVKPEVLKGIYEKD